MRVLPPQNRHRLGCLTLVVQSLEIVGHRHEVSLGGKFHGRMSPIAGRKDPQTPGSHKGFQLGLYRSELGLAVTRPIGDALR